MRTYELTIIIDAQLSPEVQEDVIAKFIEFIKAQGVEIVNMEKWGKKKLAYPIKESQYGHYLMTQFTAKQDVIPQIEHYLKLSSQVVRYLLLLRDQKTLKLMKLESERLAREAMYSAEKVREAADAILVQEKLEHIEEEKDPIKDDDEILDTDE